jgi:hypothetical protein
MKTNLLANYYENNPLRDDLTCPQDEILAQIALGAAPAEHENVSDHLMNCERCTEKMAIMMKVGVASQEHEVPKKLNRRILRKILGQPTLLKNPHLFLMGFFLFLILSFVFSGYFIQCLLLSGVCAAKWLLDQRSGSVHITLQEKSNPSPRKRHFWSHEDKR